LPANRQKILEIAAATPKPPARPKVKRVVNPAEYWPNFELTDIKLDFPRLVPHRIQCSDNPKKWGVSYAPKHRALQTKHIQFNPTHINVWMLFDIDRKYRDNGGTYFAAEEAGLPPPNIIIINRSNGHGHLAYLLQLPVAKLEYAKREPLKWF